MVLGIIDWFAIVLLFLSSVKAGIGLFSPKTSKQLKKNIMIKHYRKAKFIVFPLWLIFGAVCAFFSLKNISVSEFVVAGYGFMTLVFFLFFTKKNVIKAFLESVTKQSDSWWRLMCVIWLIITIILFYFILF